MANRQLGTQKKAQSAKAASKSTRKAAAAKAQTSMPADLPQPLSPKEKMVLEFLEMYIREHGYSPTYQEICQHFGFASFNSVQRYLKQLDTKGYIRLPWSNQKRAITLLKPASALQDAIEELQGETRSKLKQNSTSSESFSLPLLGRVAAGAPIEALDHDEFIDVPASLVRHADRTYALRVQGQSMIEDGILDGDVILVQKQSTASNGEIVVATVGDEATVKRFYLHRSDKRDKPIELRPANSSMSSMWYSADEVQIRGVVVGLIRRFF